MLAFSANSIPAVSEVSLAYFARVSAFHFNKSFLGGEDPTLEPRMRGYWERWLEACDGGAQAEKMRAEARL